MIFHDAVLFAMRGRFDPNCKIDFEFGYDTSRNVLNDIPHAQSKRDNFKAR